MNPVWVLDKAQISTYGRLKGALDASFLSMKRLGGTAWKGSDRQMRTLKIVFNDAESDPAAPASLKTLEEVQLERAVEEVRRGRVETEQAKEVVKEFGFRRVVLIAVLCMLGLVALGSLAVVAAGIVAGQYPLAAGAIAPLSGSGALSVLAWRSYIGSLRSASNPS